MATPSGVRHCWWLHVWPREHLVDVVNELGEGDDLRSRGCGRVTRKSVRDMAGIAAQHDDAVGEQHGFFDVVGHDEDGAGRDSLVVPQFQQFAAEVLRGEHVERGEGLVHEEDLRLDNQRAGKADALPHAAGELLGVGGSKAVEADGVDDPQAALASLVGAHAARLQGASTFSSTVSQGKRAKLWKTIETLGLAREMGVSCQ